MRELTEDEIRAGVLELHDTRDRDHEFIVLLEQQARRAIVLREEVARLNAVLRWTHETYCTEAYTSRGRHAPTCLLSEVDD